MAYEYHEVLTHILSVPGYETSDFEEESALNNITSNERNRGVKRNNTFYLFLTKRIFDVLFSIVLMILGLPVFFLMACMTLVTSRGPVFFKQQRLGKNRKPFYIYKFRSMRVDAEKFGPQLSSESDPRITKWGRILRRTRLDELPQFWNVLKGDMSIVGPRPERMYFVDQITEKNPNYHKLHGLKPGITSFGQVAYGYAENVDQMCERMRFDLVYLKSVSFRTDCGVILKTVGVMFSFKGK